MYGLALVHSLQHLGLLSSFSKLRNRRTRFRDEQLSTAGGQGGLTAHKVTSTNFGKVEVIIDRMFIGKKCIFQFGIADLLDY